MRRFSAKLLARRRFTFSLKMINRQGGDFDLNKYQRAQRRIAKDKQRKAEKKRNFVAQYSCLSNIFTVEHMFDSIAICRRGVWWKDQTKYMLFYAVDKIYELLDPILSHDELSRLKFLRQQNISERGKHRDITPINIEDRVQQRCFCDHSVVPVIQRSLIYDNGASQKGKGVDFARRRLQSFLDKSVNEFGREFYVLKFDFKDFFGSIPHRVCYDILLDLYDSDRMARFAMQFITQYQIKSAEMKIKDLKKEKRYDEIKAQEELIRSLKAYNGVGICLGSQISQMLAVIVPNAIDHYIKDKCGFKRYVRYMDDGLVISDSKQQLRKLLDELKPIAAYLGLQFNEKKTQIIKASKGFTFMQIRYFVNNEGKLVKKLSRSGITRMRRRLKKFHKRYLAGDMTLDDVYSSVQSWFAHARLVPRSRSIREMEKLYDELFGGYKITRRYFKLKKKYPNDDRFKTTKELINETTIENPNGKYIDYFYQM